MGELGNLLMKKQPDFDPRNFGFKKLTSLIRSIGRFEVDVRQTGDANIKHIYFERQGKQMLKKPVRLILILLIFNNCGFHFYLSNFIIEISRYNIYQR